MRLQVQNKVERLGRQEFGEKHDTYTFCFSWSPMRMFATSSDFMLAFMVCGRTYLLA